jgi:hypothetical protein
MNFRRDPPNPGNIFKPGTLVLYIPHHAHGDHNHVDCEKGIVSSKHCDRGITIFVRFATYAWEQHPKVADAILSRTPQGCQLDQLITKAEYERRISTK